MIEPLSDEAIHDIEGVSQIITIDPIEKIYDNIRFLILTKVAREAERYQREQILEELKIFSELIMKYPRKSSKEWLDTWLDIQGEQLAKE